MISHRMLIAAAAASFIACPAMAQTTGIASDKGPHYSGGPKSQVPGSRTAAVVVTTAGGLGFRVARLPRCCGAFGRYFPRRNFAAARGEGDLQIGLSALAR